MNLAEQKKLAEKKLRYHVRKEDQPIGALANLDDAQMLATRHSLKEGGVFTIHDTHAWNSPEIDRIEELGVSGKIIPFEQR